MLENKTPRLPGCIVKRIGIASRSGSILQGRIQEFLRKMRLG